VAFTVYICCASLRSHNLEYLDSALAIGRQQDTRVFLPAYTADELGGVVLSLFPLQERLPILRFATSSVAIRHMLPACVVDSDRRTVAGLAELNLNWTTGLDSAL